MTVPEKAKFELKGLDADNWFKFIEGYDEYQAQGGRLHHLYGIQNFRKLYALLERTKMRSPICLTTYEKYVTEFLKIVDRVRSPIKPIRKTIIKFFKNGLDDNLARDVQAVVDENRFIGHSKHTEDESIAMTEEAPSTDVQVQEDLVDSAEEEVESDYVEEPLRRRGALTQLQEDLIQQQAQEAAQTAQPETGEEPNSEDEGRKEEDCWKKYPGKRPEKSKDKVMTIGDLKKVSRRKVELNGLPGEALMDSGAGRNYLNKKMYDQILSKGAVVRKNVSEISMADGRKLRCELECDLKLKVFTDEEASSVVAVSRPATFVVFDDLAEEIVIGLETQKELEINRIEELKMSEIPEEPIAMAEIENERIRGIVDKHEATFGEVSSSPARMEKMVIKTKDTKPVKTKVGRASQEKEKFLRKFVKELDKNIVEEIPTSEYLSPAFVELSTESWAAFVRDFKHYASLGGTKQWPELVDAVVLTLISDLSKVKDFKNKVARKQAFDMVDKVFASTSEINLYDRLRKINGGETGCSREEIRDIFIQGLFKKRLRDCVSAICVEGTTLSETISTATKETTRLHSLELEHAALNEDESSSAALPGHVSRTRIVCQFCGKVGHSAAVCRNIPGKRRFTGKRDDQFKASMKKKHRWVTSKDPNYSRYYPDIGLRDENHGGFSTHHDHNALISSDLRLRKRRFRKLICEKAIIHFISIHYVCSFLDIELQQAIRDLPEPLRLAPSTMYQETTSLLLDDLELIKTKFVKPPYAIILDKSISRGKSVLAILV
ncbi:hypothetical protein ADUPG1_011246 [Aduncisulcus paluster]|uniref:CCHC-type domain-containing protein n=1 Tax=Aduncisulcus paluster TaxID=2918883 RepID=A0ABQ5JWX6_9EUKA|nr:hypothetical protein ADUPG1_011246 [Aduncisulcus paluster]